MAGGSEKAGSGRRGRHHTRGPHRDARDIRARGPGQRALAQDQRLRDHGCPDGPGRLLHRQPDAHCHGLLPRGRRPAAHPGALLQLPRRIWGKVSQRWWQQYERYLQILDDEVVLYDASGDTLRFDKAADGSFTTSKGYSEELEKNADGTYTVTNWKSHTEGTYSKHGTLTKVTDKNKGAITVTQHGQGDEHKGFKLTETRSGRWIDLLKADASQWQAKDNSGRAVVFDLDPAGNLHRATDADKATTFDSKVSWGPTPTPLAAPPTWRLNWSCCSRPSIHGPRIRKTSAQSSRTVSSAHSPGAR